MRHIKPSESIVMQEFEQLAADKGWLIKKASSVDPKLINAVCKEINEIGKIIPSNVSLDHILPISENGNIQRAIEIVAYNTSRHIEKSGEYYAAIDLMSDSNMEKVLSGLKSLKNVLTSNAQSDDLILMMWKALPENIKDKVLDPLDTGKIDFRQMAITQLLTYLKMPKVYKRLESEYELLNKNKPIKPDVKTDVKQKFTQTKKSRRSYDVKILQSLLFRFTNMPTSKTGFIDGIWGPMTAAAWNSLVKKYGPFMNASQVNPAGNQMPSADEMKRAIDWLKAAIQKNLGKTNKEIKENKLSKEPNKQQEFKPKEPSWVKEFQPKEPSWAKTSSVANELVSLANDLEAMGCLKSASLIDKQLLKYKKAMTMILYDLTGETGEDLIEQAHPGGGPTIAPSKEEGGKIETIVEEHKKLIDKMRKEPTGKYATIAKKLIRLADKFEKNKEYKKLNLIDKTIKKIQIKAQDTNIKQKAFRLASLFSTMLTAIDQMENFLGDQYALTATPTKKDKIYAINWSGGRRAGQPNLEYNEFAEDISDFIQNYLIGQETDVLSSSGKSNEVIKKISEILNNLENIKAFYAEFGNTRAGGPWNNIPYETFRTAALEVIKILKTSTTTSQKISPEEKKKLEGNRYKVALKQLAEALRDAQWDANKMVKLSKMIGGKDPNDFIRQIIEWINKELEINIPEHIAARSYIALIRKVIQPLIRAGIIKSITASSKSKLKKRAQPPEGGRIPFDLQRPSDGVPFSLTPGVSTKRRVSGRRRADIKNLQEILINLGDPKLNPGKADGIWGQKTKQAWDELNNRLIKATNARWKIGEGPSPKSVGPTKQQVESASRGAKYLKKIGEISSGIGKVNLPGGISVSESSLESANSFLRSLAANPNSEISGKTRAELYSPKNIGIAQAMLETYISELMTGRHPDAVSLYRQGKDIRDRISLIRDLQKQLSYRPSAGVVQTQPQTIPGVPANSWLAQVGPQATELINFPGIKLSKDAMDYIEMLFGYGAVENAGDMVNWAMYQAPQRFPSFRKVSDDKEGWRTALKYISWAMKIAGQFSSEIAKIRPPNVSPRAVQSRVMERSNDARRIYSTISGYAGRI